MNALSSADLTPDITVIVCSYDGASRLPRCLGALQRQSTRRRLEILVVDDGSRDDTSRVATRSGARVVRHPTNRGIAAARNTGARAARGDLLMFADDDVIVDERWAEELDAALTPDVAAAGGALDLLVDPGFFRGYLERNSPFRPLEIALRRDDGALRRLARYLSRQWSQVSAGARDVSAVPSGSFACRRRDLHEVGLFDEDLPAGEDSEICWRLSERPPHRRIVFRPSARAAHVTQSTLASLLARSRAYGRGACDLFVKGRVRSPTVFFAPALLAGILCASARRPAVLVGALLGPQILFPRGARTAIASRRASAALDPYIQIGLEAAHNLGFVERLLGLARSGAFSSGLGPRRAFHHTRSLEPRMPSGGSPPLEARLP